MNKKERIKQIKKELKRIKNEQFNNSVKLFWNYNDYSLNTRLVE